MCIVFNFSFENDFIADLRWFRKNSHKWSDGHFYDCSCLFSELDDPITTNILKSFCFQNVKAPFYRLCVIFELTLVLNIAYFIHFEVKSLTHIYNQKQAFIISSRKSKKSSKNFERVIQLVIHSLFFYSIFQLYKQFIQLLCLEEHIFTK